jgi:hypothetical protein
MGWGEDLFHRKNAMELKANDSEKNLLVMLKPIFGIQHNRILE